MWQGSRFQNEFADKKKKKKKGATVDQWVIMLPDTAAWHYKEVSKISLLSNIWPAEPANRGHDGLAPLFYLGLTCRTEYGSSLSSESGLQEICSRIRG